MHPIDLVRLINADELLRLVSLDTDVIQQAIDMAATLAKSYLLKRYDTEATFPEIKVWTASTSYEVGDLVVFHPAAWNPEAEYEADDQVSYFNLNFQATRATTNEAPGAGFKSVWRGLSPSVLECIEDHTSGSEYDGSKWKRETKRNPVLLSVVCDIVIYELMARAMPDTMPEVRGVRYKEALAMLSRIATGKQSIDLTPNESNTGGNRRLAIKSTGSHQSWD